MRFVNQALDKKLAALAADPSRRAERDAIERVLDTLDVAFDVATCITTKPHTDFIVQVYDRIDRERQRLEDLEDDRER